MSPMGQGLDCVGEVRVKGMLLSLEEDEGCHIL